MFTAVISLGAAIQLKDILEQRAQVALKENTLDEAVVPLCSAYAAQEHGDARRALDLFRVAAELADRDGLKRITERHVRRAQHKIELDRVTEVVRTLPTQSKLVLISIIVGERIQDDITPLTTGEVYSIYKELASAVSIDHLTQRRITDLVSELDMLGIVTARVISKGRYGRTRHIHMSTSIDKTIEVLDEDDMLRGLARYRPKIQTRLL